MSRCWFDFHYLLIHWIGKIKNIWFARIDNRINLCHPECSTEVIHLPWILLNALKRPEIMNWYFLNKHFEVTDTFYWWFHGWPKVQLKDWKIQNDWPALKFDTFYSREFHRSEKNSDAFMNRTRDFFLVLKIWSMISKRYEWIIWVWLLRQTLCRLWWFTNENSKNVKCVWMDRWKWASRSVWDIWHIQPRHWSRG